MNKKPAFTLVELLVSITILSTLATVAFLSFTSYTKNARDGKRLANIDQIETAIDIFHVYRGKYPEPTAPVDVTYSGAVVWTQGNFGDLSRQQTGKIFGDITDPLYGNNYDYSVTHSRKEYQLAYVLEGGDNTLFASNDSFEAFPQSYAAAAFSPSELNPIIWLDALDIDGDGDTGDNPNNGDTLSSWVNKGTLGAPGNPTLNGTIKYAPNGFDNVFGDGEPAIFISSATTDGIVFNGSNITNGSIIYVVQNYDPFASTDTNGVGLQSTTSNQRYIGYYSTYRNSLRIGAAPNFPTSSPASQVGRTLPTIFELHINNSNYKFLDTGYLLAQGATNSISGNTWAINKGGIQTTYADFVVSEVLVFDTVLSNSDIQKLEGYIAHKWGEEGYMPSNHPYKTTPPETSIPPAPDSTPDGFTFIDTTNAALNTQYTSNTITLSGMNTSTGITVSGGSSYNINGGAFTSSPGTVSNGNIISVRQTSSPTPNTAVQATLTIGGVSDTYTVTTLPADSTPDNFSFTAVNNAALNTQYTSNTITLSGMNTSTGITVSGGSSYNINGGAFTSSPGTVSNGNIISVRQTSSSSNSVTTSTTLTIGGVFATYNVTTPAPPPDSTPDGFTFIDVTNANLNTQYTSNAITLSGMNTSTGITVSGGSSYNINGGAFTSSPGTVSNGNIVSVRMTSSTMGDTPLNTTLTIGGVSDIYTVRTLTLDSIPNIFTINDVTDAIPSTEYISNGILVTGINTSTGITISGAGMYNINNGSYTSSPGTINNGDIIRVKQTSSFSSGLAVNTTLTMGGISDIFTVTTQEEEIIVSEAEIPPRSEVHITGNYNGLFTHSISETTGTHYIFITPSLISSNLDTTDFIDIAQEKKLVYDGYDNYPSGYTQKNSKFTSTGGFDEVRLLGPVIFEGTREELASYTGLKQVDSAVRASYQNTSIYPRVSQYLDNYGTSYVESILSNVVGINPIKPYYCSDILDKKFTYNIAPQAQVQASLSASYSGVSGTGGITNSVVSTEGNLDYEYHSNSPNAFIEFNWDTPQPVGFLRIYNRTGCCTSRLSGATVSLYDSTNTLLYAHTLWDTNNDYVIDLDLEGIGHLYDNVKKLIIQSNGVDSYINLREVEIYVGGNLQDGFYLVDSDGAGGRKSYDVYCDMMTDGGGWTRIQDNHIQRGDFSGGFHSPNYDQDWNRENNIEVLTNPTSSQYVVHQRLSTDTSSNAQQNTEYEVSLTDTSILKPGQEIRLSAWVADAWNEGTNLNGGKGYIFHNRLSYSDGTNIIDGQLETLEQQTVGGKLWKHQMVRIPIEKEVSDFKWYIGYGAETTISRNFYFTDIRAEIYYR